MEQILEFDGLGSGRLDDFVPGLPHFVVDSLRDILLVLLLPLEVSDYEYYLFGPLTPE